MDLKRLITQFTYRIEPKPEGGFVAHATDPTIPPLEAATRAELQQKIQANIGAALTTEFPGLKLPLENQQLNFAFHIERKPGGGFAIHSADPNAQSIEAAGNEEIESHFAEKLITFLGKHLAPELSQALAAQGNSGDIRVFVNRKMSLTLNGGSHTRSLITPPDGLVGSNQSADTTIDIPATTASATNAYFGSPANTITNSPITPETSSSWKIFRFLLGVLIISAIMYFFFYRR